MATPTASPRPSSQPRSSIDDHRQAKASGGRRQSELPDLSPFSTLSCQVQATNAWRRDLKSLFSRASERFADVSWAVGGGSGDETDGEGDETITAASPRPTEGIIWAHKAILYARAPNTFQARYLQLRSPAVNLGALASSSQVSLPIIRAPSPDASIMSRASSISRSRMRIRGSAPPSSFAKERTRKGRRSSSDGPVASDSENEGPGEPLRRRGSDYFSSSIGSLDISRPSSRSTFHSDALSVISSTSTIKGPMKLAGESQAFFEAMLEYLYTAEESMVEAFEFLYEDRISAGGNVEERLEKLRQDLVFMWRSRLYSDVQIVLGDGDERNAVGTIPDANASVLSFPMGEPDYADADEEEAACFSAHRMILASRSPYFAALLLSPYADQTNATLRLPSPPFTPAALHFALGFLYTGTLFFSNRTFDLATAFQLWRAGAYLQVETLQTLVASLITNDFCHGFSCWPPCKTCIKRVPRTLAFACAPDVADAYLKTLAIDAVSGPQFGAYWSKDVGNLEQSARMSIVSNIKGRIDERPGHIVGALRQLSLVGTRVDTERSSRWVDALRWMCESVETHIRAKFEATFETIVKTAEWNELVEGVGFNNDVLERALIILVDGLTERRAATIYQILVGQVLLRDEGLPSASIREILEEARGGIVRYLRRRWVGARAYAGFNKLELWTLKELAGELDVSSTDLLLPEDGEEASATAPRTRTGLQATAARTGPRLSGGPSNRPIRTAVPGDLVDGEREAGPIHMRAAVLNRNAARLSATQGFRSGTAGAAASSTPASSQYSPPTRSGSVMSRPRGSLQSIPSESEQASSRALSSAASTRSNASSTGSIRRTASPAAATEARSPTPRSHTPTAASVASSVTGASSSRRQQDVSPTTPKTSRGPAVPRNAPERSTASDDRLRTPVGSRTLAKPEGASSGAVAATSRTSLRPSASNSSMRSAKSEATQASSRAASIANFRSSPRNAQNARQEPQPAVPATSNASPATIRAKRTTTTSTDSPSVKAPRRTPSSTSLASTKSIKKVSSRHALPVGTVRAKAAALSSSAAPALPSGRNLTKSDAPLSDVTQAKTQQASRPDAMDVDPPKFTKGTLDGYEGTMLSLGIPCVVAPRDAASCQFKAVVKYLGPLAQRQGPWVGVEVSLPLPPGIDESLLNLNDGTLDGRRYFDLGPSSSKAYPQAKGAGPSPEREARRRRIARMTARPAKNLASWEKTPPKTLASLSTTPSSSMPPPLSFSMPNSRDAGSAAAADDDDSPLPIPGEEGAPPSAKRRKDVDGLGLGGIRQADEPVIKRGLFLRPFEVLWVII